MQDVIVAVIHGQPVTFAVMDGKAMLNGELVPIKGITETDVEQFRAELAKIPPGDTEGHLALVDAVRAAFLAKLLSHAVGDECVDELTRILGHVHDNVIRYLED